MTWPLGSLTEPNTKLNGALSAGAGAAAGAGALALGDGVVRVGLELVRAGAAVEAVGEVIAAAQHVVAGAAAEVVRAAPAGDHVIARAAVEQVGGVVAGERVVAGAAGHALDVRRDGVALARLALLAEREGLQIDGDGGGAGGVAHAVRAALAGRIRSAPPGPSSTSCAGTAPRPSSPSPPVSSSLPASPAISAGFVTSTFTRSSPSPSEMPSEGIALEGQRASWAETRTQAGPAAAIVGAGVDERDRARRSRVHVELDSVSPGAAR